MARVPHSLSVLLAAKKVWPWAPRAGWPALPPPALRTASCMRRAGGTPAGPPTRACRALHAPARPRVRRCTSAAAAMAQPVLSSKLQSMRFMKRASEKQLQEKLQAKARAPQAEEEEEGTVRRGGGWHLGAACSCARVS